MSSSRSAPRRSCSVSAVSFSAPLRGLANPNLTPEPAKAPWYFAGLQELLSHFDPLVAGILVPAGAVLVLVLLPYIDRNPDTRGPSSQGRDRRCSVVLLAIAVVLTVIGTFFRGPGWTVRRPVDPLVRRALGAVNGSTRADAISCATGWKLGGALLDRRRRRTPATRRCVRSRRARPAPRSRSARPTTFATGTSTYVPAGRMFVVNTNDYLFALSQKCPHLGCHVPFCESSGRFECPCHGSVYDLARRVHRGPGAARAWTATRSTLDGENVVVDTTCSEAGPARGAKNFLTPPKGPSCIGKA